MYAMVLAKFLIKNSLEMLGFFEKTFLLANINIEVVLGMLFLFFSNRNVDFVEKLEKFTWRSYIAVETLPTTS